jgi:hypothetical protein
MLKREKAINFMIETIRFLLPFAGNVRFTQKYLRIALGALQNWGLN